jgi:prophage regulatory protein
MTDGQNLYPQKTNGQGSIRTMPARQHEVVLRRPEVEARTGLSRSTIYAWMASGNFPLPVKLGTRLVAWRESDVTEWLEACKTKAA